MKKLDVPFNLDLLTIPEESLKLIRQTTSLDIYDGASKNFHQEGLYSALTFGTVGTDARMKKFSYIDIKTSILHPIIFFALGQLKGLYTDIIGGREFAVFDEELCDFIKADALTGQTGFYFFLEHWKKIKYKLTNSNKREQNIMLIEKYKDRALIQHVYVLPAGYRDIVVDESGRESSDDINRLYYKLIAISNTLNVSTLSVSPEAYNSQRLAIQNTFNEIYKMMLTIIEGKNSLFMGKFMARRVFNGTRNVITAMKTSHVQLDSENVPGINEACVGIFQYMKALVPVVRYKIKTGFISSVFVAPGAPALLCNKKTLRAERVRIGVNSFDKWMTNEGIDKLIDMYKEPSIRDTPIMVDGYYLGLTYRGPDGTFRIIHGIDELPASRSKDHCTPLTYTEFFYAMIYHESGRYPGFITRYPIESARSIFPAYSFLMSTMDTDTRVELDDQWRPIDQTHVAPRFPKAGSQTYDSLAPHPSRLVMLTADFDGDMCSWIAVCTKEALDELENTMNSRAFYVGTTGKLLANLETASISFVLKNLTGN
jgi:hypothetical protein